MTVTSVMPVYSTDTHITRHSSDTDQWDRDDTSSSHDVTGIVIGDGYQALHIDGEVKPGDRLWIIWGVYSTGDSFGHDENQCIEFFTVHRNEDRARANAALLAAKTERDRDADYSKGANVTLTLDTDETLNVYVPWLGYFESLSYVECDSFIVSGSRQSHPTRIYPNR